MSDLFDELPEPLVDSDIDCRGLPFMPLETTKLRDSELVAISTGDEFKAAVLLWAKSWSEIPAGSIPDDDRILSKAAGISVGHFQRVKSVALRGWILCSDGRFYHPLICDFATGASVRRKKRSDAANSRWAAERAKTVGKSAKAKKPRNATADASSNANAMLGTVKGTVEDSPKPSHGDLPSIDDVGGPSNMSLRDYFDDEKNRVHVRYPSPPEKRKAEVWHMAKSILEVQGMTPAAAGTLVGQMVKEFRLEDDDVGNIALRIFEAKPTAARPFAIGCARQIARERDALENRRDE